MATIINEDGSPSGADINPTPQNYFILETQTEDWQWILQGHILAKGLTEAKDAFVRVNVSGGHPHYYLSREKFTVEEIASIIGFKGTDFSVFEDVEIIYLKPIGNQTDWQKPSVKYAGRA